MVTGGSSGIGLATAQAAAEHGDHVVLVARGRPALERAAEQCSAAGAASVRVAPVDVGDAEAVQRLVDSVVGEHGRLDAVVHCAGVVAYGRFEDIPVELFDAVLHTNVIGSANVARAVLPSMRERDSGSIVLVGSVIGQIAAPMMTPYAVSKWAMRSLGRQLQVENRDRPGVQISMVSPAGVDTPIYLQAANYHGHVGRPPPPVISPERVARACLRVLEHPRRTLQVGSFNTVMTLGFSLLPPVYDRIVGPLFQVAAIDLRHPVGPGPGNVLASVPDGNRLRGLQGSAVLSLLGSVRRRLGAAS
jgi:short-subunit dehydrogenase